MMIRLITYKFGFKFQMQMVSYMESLLKDRDYTLTGNKVTITKSMLTTCQAVVKICTHKMVQETSVSFVPQVQNLD